MPTVPNDPVPEGLGQNEASAQVSITEFMMAMATMHNLGRFPQLPASENIEDRRDNPTEGDRVDQAGEIAALRTRRSVLYRGSDETRTLQELDVTRR